MPSALGRPARELARLVCRQSQAHHESSDSGSLVASVSADPLVGGDAGTASSSTSHPSLRIATAHLRLVGRFTYSKVALPFLSTRTFEKPCCKGYCTHVSSILWPGFI